MWGIVSRTNPMDIRYKSSLETLIADITWARPNLKEFIRAWLMARTSLYSRETSIPFLGRRDTVYILMKLWEVEDERSEIVNYYIKSTIEELMSYFHEWTDNPDTEFSFDIDTEHRIIYIA